MPGTNRPGSDPAGPFRPAVDSIANFFDYQFNPEKYAKPGQRVKPGLAQGYKYDLQPGESYDDVGQVRDASGQPVEFINRPKLSTLVDLIGNMTGGIAGAPKGALGSGGYRAVSEARYPKIQPGEFAGHPGAVEAVAEPLEALRKRAGWQGQDITEELKQASYAYKNQFAPPVAGTGPFDKMDPRVTKWRNSVSSLSAPPSNNAMGVADNAVGLGYDKPMVHVSGNMLAEAGGKTGLPWRYSDPFASYTGATYFANVPDAAARAAQVGGSPRLYSALLGGRVYGHDPIPEKLFNALPDRVPNAPMPSSAHAIIDKLNMGSVPNPDIMAALREGADPAITEAIMEQYLKSQGVGQNSYQAGLMRTQLDMGDEKMAESLSRMLYGHGDEAGAKASLTPRLDFEPIRGGSSPHQQAAGIPYWSDFENGAMQGDRVHSPWQNALLRQGFSGSRIADETGQVPGGATMAMIDPASIRSTFAKFKNPTGNDVMSAKVPYPWLAGFNVQGQENQ